MIRTLILFFIGAVSLACSGCQGDLRVPDVVRRLESKWNKESYSFDFRSFRQHTDESGNVFQQVGVVGKMKTNGNYVLQALSACASEDETTNAFDELTSAGDVWTGDLLNLSNPNYSAQIAKKSGDKYVLNSVSENNGVFGFSLQNLSMFDMSDPLWKLLQDKYEFVDSKEIDYQGIACQSVEFNADMSGMPVKCSHIFNSELQCLRQEISYTEGDYKGTKIVTVFEYPNSQSLLPMKIVVVGNGKSAKQAMKSLTVVKKIAKGEILDSSKSFLSYYGLPNTI